FLVELAGEFKRHEFTLQLDRGIRMAARAGAPKSNGKILKLLADSGFDGDLMRGFLELHPLRQSIGARQPAFRPQVSQVLDRDLRSERIDGAKVRGRERPFARRATQ